MNSRDRVRKVLNGEKPDRIPVDFGSTHVTGISASIVHKLNQYYFEQNEKYSRVKVVEPYQMLGEITDQLREFLCIDTIGLFRQKNMFGFENKDWKPWHIFDGTPVLVPGQFNTELSEDGSILMYPEGDKTSPPSARMPLDGFYFDTIIRQVHIDDKNLKVEDNLEEFKIISDEELKYFEEQAEYLYKNTDFSIVGNFGGTSFGDIAFVPAPSLKYPKGIRNIEEWYVSTIARRNYIYEIFEKQCEIGLKNLELIYQAVSNKVDVVFITGTDFGTQNGPFLSNNLYKELYQPFHKRVNDWVHKSTNWKTFIHSCGGIEPLITELIDSGFDIFNPVQCSACGMDAQALVNKYGFKIIFWGGGVDTQKTLPFGTPQQVHREVQERIKIFSKAKGFVFNTVHNIQPKTPVENILSMFQVIKDYKYE